MRKRVLEPNAGDDLREEDSTAYSESVVVEAADHSRVYVSGATSDEPHGGDIGEQTRDVLGQIRDIVTGAGGGMSDVVRVRVYVEEPHLVQEEFEKVHDARREFFDADAYPASTLVEVSKLIREDRVIEIDADAVVPHDGWD